MDTTRITRQMRLSKWTAIFRAQQESGQTVRKYCNLNGISTTTYYHWQRRMRAIEHEELVSGAEMAPGGWAVYSPARNKVSIKTTEVIVEVGGCLIHANDRVEPELLVKVCRALRALC